MMGECPTLALTALTPAIVRSIQLNGVELNKAKSLLHLQALETPFSIPGPSNKPVRWSTNFKVGNFTIATL